MADVPPLNVSEGIAAPWYSGDWFGGLKAPFVELMGEAPAAVLLLFIVGSSIWIYTKRTDITVVSMMVLGGIMAPSLPASVRSMAFMIVLFGSAYALWRTYANRERY